jgi:hypothetical protein
MRTFLNVNLQGGWMTRGVASNTVWNQYPANDDTLSCNVIPRLVRRELLGKLATCPIEYTPAAPPNPRPRPGSDPWLNPKNPRPTDTPPDDPLVVGPPAPSGTPPPNNPGGGGDGGKPDPGKPNPGKPPKNGPPTINCSPLDMIADTIKNGPCGFPSTKPGCSYPNALMDTLLGSGPCQIDQSTVCGPGVNGPGTYRACPGEDPALVVPPKPTFDDGAPYRFVRDDAGNGTVSQSIRRWLSGWGR